jgi:peptidoglycan hydrolase-like amidase
MRKGFIFLVALVVIGAITFKILAYTNVETFTAKVAGKERITEKSGDDFISFYLVYTDKGTFKLEDDLFRGNFRSSDTYGKLRQDSTYTFTTAGYRIGIMSSYPNIIEVK